MRRFALWLVLSGSFVLCAHAVRFCVVCCVDHPEATVKSTVSQLFRRGYLDKVVGGGTDSPDAAAAAGSSGAGLSSATAPIAYFRVNVSRSFRDFRHAALVKYFTEKVCIPGCTNHRMGLPLTECTLLVVMPPQCDEATGAIVQCLLTQGERPVGDVEDEDEAQSGKLTVAAVRCCSARPC